MLNLNEPCRMEDTSWIQPMRYIGIWWAYHMKHNTWHAGPEHGATTENTMRHIDFAAANNMGGVLVEGWNEDWATWKFRFVNDVMPETRVHTTLAKQLALFVVLYSPLQMASDEIENYEANPEPFKFIASCPTDWSRTVVPEARIGSYVTIARREKGEGCWFVGSITGDEERTAVINLSFLDADKKYLATIYRDAPESDYETCPAAILMEEREVSSGDTLTVWQARSGGTAIRLCPIGK